MVQSKMDWLRECHDDPAREEVGERQFTHGGEWIRVLYERRDGRIQDRYIIFDSGGRVHCFFDGVVQAETERRLNYEPEAQGLYRRSYSPILVSK